MNPMGNALKGTAIVAVLAALATTACAPDPPRVLVIGDSITGLVADDFAQQDEEEFRYTLRATNGATATEMLAEAQDVGDVNFTQVVINLGTNDALKDVPLEETMASVNKIVDLFPDTDCIHVTTINEHILSFEDATVTERIIAINDGLRELADGRPRIRVADWNAVVEEYEAAGSPDGPLFSDSVHPTEVGQQKLVDLEVSALETCL